MSYYVLLGGPEHFNFFKNHSRYRKHQWFWTVPKDAQPGETGFVYMSAPVTRLVGQLEIIAEPFYNVDMFAGEKVKNRWMAEIGKVKYFEERADLTIRGLRALFPEWGWLRYPRSKVRIPDEMLQPFLELINDHKEEAQNEEASKVSVLQSHTDEEQRLRES
jgi:hypothetical protein